MPVYPGAIQTSARASSDKAGRDRIAFSHSLPDLDGRHLKVTLVEVTYGPGEYSKPHSRPCPVIVYVLEGALRTQVKDEPEATYKAGKSSTKPLMAFTRFRPMPAKKIPQNSSPISFVIATCPSASPRQNLNPQEESSHERYAFSRPRSKIE